MSARPLPRPILPSMERTMSDSYFQVQYERKESERW